METEGCVTNVRYGWQHSWRSRRIKTNIKTWLGLSQVTSRVTIKIDTLLNNSVLLYKFVDSQFRFPLKIIIDLDVDTALGSRGNEWSLTFLSSSVNCSFTISISLGGSWSKGSPSKVEFLVRRRSTGWRMAWAREPANGASKNWTLA